MSKQFYASQSPRGFVNETNVYAFPTRKDRDAWVMAHEDDGGCNAAALGAYKISAKRAYQIIGDRGDAATAEYNRLIPADLTH